MRKYKTREVAEILHVSNNTIYRIIKSLPEQLKPKKSDDGVYEFTAEDVSTLRKAVELREDGLTYAEVKRELDLYVAVPVHEDQEIEVANKLNEGEEIMNELTLKGLAEVDGMKFNHIEGGFGENKKAMLVKDIAEIHGREVKDVNRSINSNIKRFKNGVDVLDLKTSAYDSPVLKSVFTPAQIGNANNIYLLSERGYSKLLKILEDDFAWEQYEKLVDGYFSMRETIQAPTKKLPAMDLLKLQYEVLGEHDERLNYLENNMTIDYGQQQQLQNTAKSKVIKALGGIHSNAYKERSVRGKVFSAIWKDYKDYFMLGSYKDTARVNFDKALDFFNDWTVPGRVLREIEDCNKQMSL